MNKIIQFFFLIAVLVNSITAQVITNGAVTPSIGGEVPFFDAATNFDFNLAPYNEGKGLVFPRTNLTTWAFKLDALDGVLFPTAFNGMIVYNTGVGNTLTGLNNPNLGSVVTPGFYYFYNPNATTSVALGKWIRLGATSSSLSSGGSAVVASYNCATDSSGSITVGIPVAGVTQTITALVTTLGTYNINTTVNGITFSASGTFTATGTQNIVLTATGTPSAIGTNSFNLNTIPNCSFSRTTVQSSTNGTGIVSSYTCSTASTGSLFTGVAVSGVTQTITATVTAVGTYAISTSANGVNFAATGTFTTTGAQNIVLIATGTPVAAGTNTFTLNTTPNCNFTRTTSSITPLPPNIILASVPPHFIASVYDTDYLPYTTPTQPASLATLQPANGINEVSTTNIQGTLTTTGVTIRIPYTVVTASVNLPAFNQTITIPSSYTEDGISRNITLSYSAGTIGVGSGYISASLRAVGGTLNVKKLDIQTGIGNDVLGWLLGQFTYATNNSGGTSGLAVRAIAAIPDRNISNANHVMFYLPVRGEDGNIWLNNNLGAYYSNTASSFFNLTQQATTFNDYRAYGSLFQWGRYSDGHELINYTNGTDGFAVNGTTTILSANDTPTNSLFITNSSSPFDWRTPQNNSLWQDEGGSNNPCPIGFRLPTNSETATLFGAANISNYTNAANSNLRLSAAGIRNSDGIVATQSFYGYYWSSTINGSDAAYRSFYNVATFTGNYYRSGGFSVRCIKDQ